MGIILSSGMCLWASIFSTISRNIQCGLTLFMLVKRPLSTPVTSDPFEGRTLRLFSLILCSVLIYKGFKSNHCSLNSLHSYPQGAPLSPPTRHFLEAAIFSALILVQGVKETNWVCFSWTTSWSTFPLKALCSQTENFVLFYNTIVILNAGVLGKLSNFHTLFHK